MLMRGLRNERGTKGETANCGRIQVLTRSSGSAINGGNLPLRPDGGVVTQRTANPLRFFNYSQKSARFSRRVSSLAFLFASGHFGEHSQTLLTLLPADLS
jgi:hypothetical protein